MRFYVYFYLPCKARICPHDNDPCVPISIYGVIIGYILGHSLADM